MYFSISEENVVTGQTKEVNLVPNGSEVKVTSLNKFRYIYLMADYRLNRRIKEQSDAFVAGFHECIPLKWLGNFNERELQMLMSGARKSIDVADLKKHTQYIGGYTSSSRVIKDFWKLVEKGMNQEEQSKLLKFVTSCPRQPLMGFGAMVPTFTISKLDCDMPD